MYVTLVDSGSSRPGAGAGGGIASLGRWLDADPGLAGAVRRDHTAGGGGDGGGGDGTGHGDGSRHGDGRMGGAVEIIDLVVSNSLALASLLTSVLSWRNSRPSAPEILVVLADGRTLTADRETIERLRNGASVDGSPTGSPTGTPDDRDSGDGNSGNSGDSGDGNSGGEPR
ncbi:hypothetical protein [Streptomyces sp. NPDC002564]|uniref:effector-associated constant component EACC1 n=1 Tax=Streptomyces sp. NPDC002564 TaxID=3364649 RepID=UPI0036CD425A